jgi:hypothetical protein
MAHNDAAGNAAGVGKVEGMELRYLDCAGNVLVDICDEFGGAKSPGDEEENGQKGSDGQRDGDEDDPAKARHDLSDVGLMRKCKRVDRYGTATVRLSSRSQSRSKPVPGVWWSVSVGAGVFGGTCFGPKSMQATG